MWPYRSLLIILLLLLAAKSYCQQQDVEFHLNAQFLQGKKVLKVKRDFYDPYVWVLAQNNQVYRINSRTQVIDDFTPQFAAYNNLEFIDIAGQNKNIVFIATNSNTIIQLKNGAMRLLGPADGIPGTVNSVGMYAGIHYNLIRPTPQLMIATDKGFRLYNTTSEKVIESTDNGNSKVYEATYRTIAYKDSSRQTSDFITQDSIVYQPLIYVPGVGSTNVEYLWEGGKSFGANINTATPIYESVYIYNPVFTNIFWGNDRGMFQNDANYSYYSIHSPWSHYLNGIKVNKITNIYGLVSLGAGLSDELNTRIKQNLLVGTDNGLYFSSSLYTSSPNNKPKLALFHDDDLGNTPVNDVCVNLGDLGPPLCEDGVWVATNNGLYYLKPDYAKYFNVQQINAIYFKGLPDGTKETKICEGSSVQAGINESEYSGHNIQWYKDGHDLPGESKPTLAIQTAGDYNAVLYDPCENIHLETNHLKVDVINGPVFSFNYPNKIQHCDKIPVPLKTDDNPGYQYRWYTNGLLNGETSAAYTVTQTGKYKVEVSACNGTWVPSKEIEVDLVDLPVPQVTADKTAYCTSEEATLSADAPLDAAYTINWYKDGNLLAADKGLVTIKTTTAGSYTVQLSSTITDCVKSSLPQVITYISAPVFSFNYPDNLTYCAGTPVTLKTENNSAYQYRWYKDGVLTGDAAYSLSITQNGKYKIEVSACSGSWVASKEVEVDFVRIPDPVITPDKAAHCMGGNAILSTNVVPDPDYTINWYRDNVLLPGYQDHTSITTNIAGNYTVSVISGVANTDGSFCTYTSPVQNVLFNELPTINIQQIVKTTLCDGQIIDLKATYRGGKVKWSTGETSDQITVQVSGTYKAIITSDAGCQAEASIDVQFLPNPVLNVPNSSVCIYSGKTATLTAPAGYSQYMWNGQPGGQTFKASHPQAVTLTVTDINGCQATQLITVADECPDVKIPNTFTPNGDGINDRWGIQGLENDPTVLVKIYTRNGSQIYQSRGYGTPWNGEYSGKKLPTGVYYYVITAKSGSQKYSGYVAIIY